MCPIRSIITNIIVVKSLSDFGLISTYSSYPMIYRDFILLHLTILYFLVQVLLIRTKTIMCVYIQVRYDVCMHLIHLHMCVHTHKEVRYELYISDKDPAVGSFKR